MVAAAGAGAGFLAAVVVVAAACVGEAAEPLGLLMLLELLPQAERTTAAATASVGMMHFMDRGMQPSCVLNRGGSHGASAAKDGPVAVFLPLGLEATGRSGT